MMGAWWQHLWCRAVYGHIMIPYGVERNASGNCRESTYYMCARCLLCERLYFIGRNTEAE